MKKRLAVIPLLLALLICNIMPQFVGYRSPAIVAAKSKDESISIVVGESKKLNLKNVKKWTSSNNGIVTVSKKGEIIAQRLKQRLIIGYILTGVII